MDPIHFKDDYQTPKPVCDYMAAMIPANARWVLEPTPGQGNLSAAAVGAGYNVIEPEDFFLLTKELTFDAVIMNPPFSSKYIISDNIPVDVTETGMRLGYHILKECMKMTNHVIALMPWFILLDSDVRVRMFMKYGLKSVTALPRKSFNYARIQTCILELHRGYKGKTEYKVFDSHLL